jgi:hypothetical protein
MTLVERISQLQLSAAAADDEGKLKSRSGEFTALRERLAAATINAEDAEAGRKELQASGIVEDGNEQSRTASLAIVKEMAAAVESLSVEAKFDALNLQGRNVEQHFKTSEKLVADVWRNYVFSIQPTVDDELLDALERGGVDVETIRSDIEDAKSVLLMLRTRRLPKDGDIAKLQKARSTLNSSGESIGKLIDPAIADVVVRAQNGGVPYTEITSEIVSALKKFGILNRFRVVLK